MTSFTYAIERIDRKIDRAARLGIRVSAKVALFDPRDISTLTNQHSWSAGRTYDAASINKLAIALYVMDKHRHADPHKTWETRGSAEGLSFSGSHFLRLVDPLGVLENTTITWEREDVRPGAGRYDNPDEPREATLRSLLTDMLGRSGNTAMVVLGRHNAPAVNALLEKQGLTATRLVERENGFFETGYTTAAEALDLFRAVALSEPVTEVAAFAESGLSRSRSHVPLGRHALEIVSKHGELNGADNDGVFVRHEVGLVNSLGTTIPLYSVFTETDAVWRAKVAGQVIGQIGAVMMSAAGMRPPLLAPALGRIALIQ